MTRPANAEPGFGIYIHWPFCAAKCPYCDFNSHVVSAVDHDAWRSALVHDLQRQIDRSDPAVVTSVYFGGGTPSLMAAETVEAILNVITRDCRTADDVEVTLEANPTSVEAARFQAYRAAGVNRVSLGVQALNDADLKALGRLHSAREAMAAFDVGRRFFDRMSFDLIYARQHQTLDDWTAELGQALALAGDHLSLYQLTIEPGTRFGDLFDRNGLRGLPDPDLSYDLYAATVEVCRSSGFDAYEVSNFCRPGAEGRHNLTYWRYGAYLGVGPGAHGRRVESGARFATEAHALPKDWLETAGTAHVEAVEVVNPVNQGIEYALMSLRLKEGMSLGRFEALSRSAPPSATTFLEANLLETDGDRIWATDAGRLVLNRLTSEWLAPLL